MFCLVCFDIVEDRTRNKVGKVLKGYGYRVQKSVFECPGLGERDFLKIKDRIEGLIDFEEDNVRYYFLCRGCLRRFENSGLGVPPDLDEFTVI